MTKFTKIATAAVALIAAASPAFAGAGFIDAGFTDQGYFEQGWVSGSSTFVTNMEFTPGRYFISLEQIDGYCTDIDLEVYERGQYITGSYELSCDEIVTVNVHANTTLRIEVTSVNGHEAEFEVYADVDYYY